jgi:hypothetical protein
LAEAGHLSSDLTLLPEEQDIPQQRQRIGHGALVHISKIIYRINNLSDEMLAPEREVSRARCWTARVRDRWKWPCGARDLLQAPEFVFVPDRLSCVKGDGFLGFCG